MNTHTIPLEHRIHPVGGAGFNRHYLATSPSRHLAFPSVPSVVQNLGTPDSSGRRCRFQPAQTHPQPRKSPSFRAHARNPAHRPISPPRHLATSPFLPCLPWFKTLEHRIHPVGGAGFNRHKLTPNPEKARHSERTRGIQPTAPSRHLATSPPRLSFRAFPCPSVVKQKKTKE